MSHGSVAESRETHSHTDDEMKPNKQLLTSTAASVTSVLDSRDAAVGALRMRKWQQCI